jgi:LysM repeat protein
MSTLRQVALGLVIALISLSLMLGVFSLSLAEGNRVAPTATQPPSATPTWQPFTPQPPSPTSPAPTPTLTASLPPPPTSCPAPQGWIAYQVQPSDNLEDLAESYQVSVEELAQANCLVGTELPVGAVLYVPPIPTATPVPCGPPDDWVRYTVRPGDTLYAIARARNTKVSELQKANCLTSTLLRVGQLLYVPPGGGSGSTAVPSTPITFTLIPVTDTDEYYEPPTETTTP